MDLTQKVERLIGTCIRSSPLEVKRALITLQPHIRNIATDFADILNYTRLSGWLLKQNGFAPLHMIKLHIGHLHKPGRNGGLSALAFVTQSRTPYDLIRPSQRSNYTTDFFLVNSQKLIVHLRLYGAPRYTRLQMDKFCR
jgi:hypothetical protein